MKLNGCVSITYFIGLCNLCVCVCIKYNQLTYFAFNVWKTYVEAFVFNCLKLSEFGLQRRVERHLCLLDR